MSKQCMVRREKEREKLSKKFMAKRKELRKIINSLHTSLEEKELAQAQYGKMRKDSSFIRRRNRCAVTGRARGVYRIFGVCRHVIRKLAALKHIPGLHKASW